MASQAVASAMNVVGDPEQCIKDHCKSQATSCEFDSTCRDFTNCAKGCKDESCVAKCEKKHMDSKVKDLINCAVQHHCENATMASQAVASAMNVVGDPEHCIKDHCKSQATSCEFDSTCRDFTNCAKGCKDESCVAKCEKKHMDSKVKDLINCAVQHPCENATMASQAVASTIIAFHSPAGMLSPFRVSSNGGTCTGPHESCCPAPMNDPNNCPASARTSDCDAKKSCCCG